MQKPEVRNINKGNMRNLDRWVCISVRRVDIFLPFGGSRDLIFLVYVTAGLEMMLFLDNTRTFRPECQ